MSVLVLRGPFSFFWIPGAAGGTWAVRCLSFQLLATFSACSKVVYPDKKVLFGLLVQLHTFFSEHLKQGEGKFYNWLEWLLSSFVRRSNLHCHTSLLSINLSLSAIFPLSLSLDYISSLSDSMQKYSPTAINPPPHSLNGNDEVTDANFPRVCQILKLSSCSATTFGWVTCFHNHLYTYSHFPCSVHNREISAQAMMPSLLEVLTHPNNKLKTLQ
jgi:hypothetical protein